jgi:23S rRNA pseudouridine2605 synthase
MERIQKIIANSGYCSRRKAEELIEKKKVLLNGKVAVLGDKAEVSDKIIVDGKSILKEDNFYYYILNKPIGVLVTKEDPDSRKTIYNLESMKKLENKIGQRLNYVGRLDAMSEGLLILTNDGDFCNKMTHPSHVVEKTYLVRTEPKLNDKDVKKLKDGVMIEERKLFAKIDNQKENFFEITIQEGRNRIIRKTLDKLGYKIFKLERIKFGKIKLNNLKAGEVREITEDEIKLLKSV